MMLCNLPFRSDGTCFQDLKLQDLHFCADNERQDLVLFGWYKPNLILPANLDLGVEFSWGCRSYSHKEKFGYQKEF